MKRLVYFGALLFMLWGFAVFIYFEFSEGKLVVKSQNLENVFPNESLIETKDHSVIMERGVVEQGIWHI